MGVWTEINTGVWRLVGSGRTVLIADEDFPAESAFRVQLARPVANHNVRLLVYSSGDGRSCFEVGLVGGNIQIRSIQWGDPLTAVVHDTAPHGLDPDLPFTLEVRVVNGVIEGRLNGSDTPIVSYDNGGSPTPRFVGYKHFGFTSSTNGAVVLNPTLFPLEPDHVERADVLIAVIGGDVIASTDGIDYRLIAASVFNPTGPVSLCDYEQKMYGVDGAHGMVIDPFSFSVEKWAPTAGALPGATEDPDNPGEYLPGTTTATCLARHWGRLWFAGMRDDPQNIVSTAVNDPLDLDTGSRRVGRAFGLTAADIGRVGQPVKGLAVSARNTIVLGCSGSVWEFIGDPALGPPILAEILPGHGISSKDAFTKLSEGRLVIHTPEGAFILPAVGEPIPLSQDVLTTGMQIPREEIDNYLVQVRRDVRRCWIHFFFTPKIGAGRCIHLCYDERVGKFIPTQGGWFPDSLAEHFGPTASTAEPWLGRLILGTRDGYLIEFKDDQRSDVGEVITTRIRCTLMDQPALNRETILTRFLVLGGDGMGAIKWRLYGGTTPEKAWGITAGGVLLCSGTITGVRRPQDRRVRALCLTLELYNDELDGTLEIEDIDARTEAGRMLTQRELAQIVNPGAPCTHKVPPSEQPSSSASEGFSSGPGFTSAFSESEGSSPASITGIPDTEPGESISAHSATEWTDVGFSDSDSGSSPPCTAVTLPIDFEENDRFTKTLCQSVD